MRLLALGLVLLVGGAVIAWAATGTTTGGARVAGVAPSANLVVLDSSGSGHHGIRQGDPDVGLPGRHGRAYGFGRVGSWVQVQPAPGLNPEDRQFYLSAWINFPRDPSRFETYDIIRKGLSYTPGGEFKLEILSRGRVKCSAKDAAGHEERVILGDVDVTDGRWHRVGCARTAGKWLGMADGVVVAKGTALGSIANDASLAIGSKYGNEDIPPGLVDDVRFTITQRPTGTRNNGPARLGRRLAWLESQPHTGWWRLDEVPPRTGSG